MDSRPDATHDAGRTGSHASAKTPAGPFVVTSRHREGVLPLTGAYSSLLDEYPTATPACRSCCTPAGGWRARARGPLRSLPRGSGRAARLLASPHGAGPGCTAPGRGGSTPSRCYWKSGSRRSRLASSPRRPWAEAKSAGFGCFEWACPACACAHLCAVACKLGCCAGGGDGGGCKDSAGSSAP